MPWDMGFPSRELTRVLECGLIKGRTAFEFGCGTGHNACLLAERGFQVTAVDCAELAIERARERALNKRVQVEFFQSDVCQLPEMGRTFDFVFDRGCFHCVRQTDVSGYIRSLEKITAPGSRFLLLTGNANEQREGGPPRLREQELRTDLEPLFQFDELREFRFDDPDGPTGPLAWSCLMIRRNLGG